jgi:hypothetical protein
MPRKPVDSVRVTAFLEALAGWTSAPTTLYLVGGATAVTVGWRVSTIDIDLVLRPEDEGALRAIPRLKEELDINVELASPLDHLPELPDWQERSPFVAQVGPLTVRQFDPYAQALAKLERGFSQDIADVDAMVERQLVEPPRLVELFDAIADALYRFPTVDPDRLRAAAVALAGPPG